MEENNWMDTSSEKLGRLSREDDQGMAKKAQERNWIPFNCRTKGIF